MFGGRAELVDTHSCSSLYRVSPRVCYLCLSMAQILDYNVARNRSPIRREALEVLSTRVLLDLIFRSLFKSLDCMCG